MAENVIIPMRVQDAPSIRCIYAYVQKPGKGSPSAFLVKISKDGGTIWQPLEYMGIAIGGTQAGPFRNTYDYLIATEGYGPPETRRLPYNDFGCS